MLSQSLPYWPINPWYSRSVWLDFQMDFVRCLWALFPARVLWGASFPLALAAAASPEQDPGQLVGRVYAANTLGPSAARCSSAWRSSRRSAPSNRSGS
jgi:spermidine synthase